MQKSLQTSNETKIMQQRESEKERNPKWLNLCKKAADTKMAVKKMKFLKSKLKLVKKDKEICSRTK